jgi:hypothetical protein
MTSIVQKWATVGSTYFTENLDPCKKPQKKDLTTVLKTSLRAISNESTTDADVAADAFLNVTKRFQRAYSKLNMVQKIYFRILGVFRFSLIGRYSQFIDKLVQIAASHYAGNLKGLIEKYVSTQDQDKKVFFEKLVCHAKKHIDLQKRSTGFIYKVVNNNGVTSYLVGSVLFESKDTLRDKRFDEIFTFSKEFIPVVDPKFVPAELNLDHSKWCFSTDRRLAGLAKKKHMKIVPLGTPDEHHAQLSSLFAPELQQTATSLMSSEEQKRAASHHDFLHYEGVEAWQNGDEEELAAWTRTGVPTSIFQGQMTRKWLYGEDQHIGLLQKVQDTKVPICISVPAFCCVGKEGMVKAFRACGLKVSRFLRV